MRVHHWPCERAATAAARSAAATATLSAAGAAAARAAPAGGIMPGTAVTAFQAI